MHDLAGCLDFARLNLLWGVLKQKVYQKNLPGLSYELDYCFPIQTCKWVRN